MPPATEWPQVVRQSMRVRLSCLTRRVAGLEACSGPGPKKSRRSDDGDDPSGPLLDDVLDAVDAFNTEQRQVINRLRCPKATASVASAPPARPDNDPLHLLFDAVESINGELTSFATRLAQLEDTVKVQAPPRCTRLVRSPSAATVHAARGRQVRTAVSHA